jgi:hypothetical protein
MRGLKEPLSRLANREEQTRGASFEGRFKSVAILHEASLLATCAYIDLNPVAAGIAEIPEASAHISIKQRIGEPFIQHRERGFAAAHTARPAPPDEPRSQPVPAAPAPARPETVVPAPAPLRLDDPSPVLDIWIGGPPQTRMSPGSLFQNKTNPTPRQHANGRRAARRRNHL